MPLTPDLPGLIIGLLSIAAIILLFCYADALADGNIRSET